jgi:hypothetical protein
MKIVIKTFLFHLLCILIFAFLYYYHQQDFDLKKFAHYNSIDYILLSTTIQAGVGISDIYPVSFMGKTLMIIQQMIMLMTHIFTLYIFNL